MMDDKENSQMKRINDDLADALDRCASSLSISELSRITGVRIELLRRYITRKTRHIRQETWEKIYPVIKPYLALPEKEPETPPIRIGAPYRRHNELVELFSDCKVLLDVFNALAPADQRSALEHFQTLSPADPLQLTSLNEAENRLLGCFEAMPPEVQNRELLTLVETATAEMHKKRNELF